MIEDAVAGSIYSLDHVVKRESPGLWSVHLHCGGCVSFRFAVAEQMGESSLRAQVRDQMHQHEAAH